MKRSLVIMTFLAALVAPQIVLAAGNCPGLPSSDAVRAALRTARAEDNGGLNNDVWGTVVDRFGVICAVVYSGSAVDAQWPASRLISAQKAYTANGFSLPQLALSTANLYSAVQPGGSLYGLHDGNPINTHLSYGGAIARWGQNNDPLIGQIVGGTNTFGGGVPLYSARGAIIGGLGISGDTSCADHNVAWRTRALLNLDYVPAGMSSAKNDQIIYDITGGASAGGYGHPTCGGTEANAMKTLPPTRVTLTQ